MKQQLAQLIESYAAARVSGNAILQQYATQQLQQLLDSVDITALPQPTTEESTDGEDS